MNNKKKTILVVFVVGILALIYTLASTYAVIIEVQEEEGRQEIINKITLKDLVTDDNGQYNSYYYDIKRELDITDTEATILMSSQKLNEHLQTVLDSIVDYKLNKNYNAKLSNNQIYNLIIDGIHNTGNVSDELRNKVINKSNIYKQDIVDFLYDIDVTLIG